MSAAVPLVPSEVPVTADQRVFLYGVTWKEYEVMLAVRGESAVPRMSYLKGTLELMSPSYTHETVKKLLARLVEAYAEERELDLNGFGSWTLRNPLVERGCEPDECYSLGVSKPDCPDLAIEVSWTSGGIDKLEIYRGLGVQEVWIWKAGRIHVYLLRGESYETAERSALLPELDLELVTSFLDRENQTQAVREFRKALRR